MKRETEIALNVLKTHIEKLGIDKLDTVTLSHQVQLRDSLRQANELGLANMVQEFQSPNELEDFIVNTIYG